MSLSRCVDMPKPGGCGEAVTTTRRNGSVMSKFMLVQLTVSCFDEGSVYDCWSDLE